MISDKPCKITGLPYLPPSQTRHRVRSRLSPVCLLVSGRVTTFRFNGNLVLRGVVRQNPAWLPLRRAEGRHPSASEAHEELTDPRLCSAKKSACTQRGATVQDYDYRIERKVPAFRHGDISEN